MKVRNRMSTSVVTIDSDASITEAFRIMKENNIRRLPVLDKGKLTGIVTLSDLNQASPSMATSLSIHELNYLLARTKIKDITPRDQELVTIHPDSYIETAARVMVDKHISGLPVVENDQLVGIITETDLFRALIDILGVQRPHTRIDTYVAEGPGGLAEITGLMAARDINIINTVVYYDQTLNKYKVILRIEEPHYQPVVDDLQARGLQVESVIVYTRVD